MKYTLFLLITCASCTFVDDYEYRVDSNLKRYVDQFYNDANSHNVHLLKDNLVVTTREGVADERHVTGYAVMENQIMAVLDQGVVNRLIERQDTISLKYIVYHELGHALLRRQHTPEYSIMRTPGPWAEFGDIKERPNLINELFHNHGR